MEETVSREIYEDTHSLLREILKEMSSKLDVGLSFKFNPSEESMGDTKAAPPKLDASFDTDKKEVIKEISDISKIRVNDDSHCNLFTI